MRKAFTLIELIVVLGILAVLLALTSINFLTGQRHVTKIGVVEQIVADIRSQQSKAMVGDGSGLAFGAHINAANYVLFSGASFNPADTSNFVVNLDNNIELSSTFASNNIVFSPISGEVSGFVNGQDTITVIDATDNTVKVLHVNKYGVVDSAN